MICLRHLKVRDVRTTSGNCSLALSFKKRNHFSRGIAWGFKSDPNSPSKPHFFLFLALYRATDLADLEQLLTMGA
jgi:hypothetical protein